VKKLHEENEKGPFLRASQALSDKLEKYTGVARDMGDASQNIPPESPWAHVNRAMLEDEGKSHLEWQKEKDTLKDFQKETDSRKSHGEIEEGALGSDSTLRNLMIEGINDAQKRFIGEDPGMFNRQMNRTIAISKGLEDMAKSQPEVLQHALSYALSGAAGGLSAMFGHVLGMQPSVPMGLGAATLGGGLVGGVKIATNMLLKDPVARARFGDYLRRQQGSGMGTKVFSNVPRLKILGSSGGDINKQQ